MFFRRYPPIPRYGPIPRYVLEQTCDKPSVQWRDKIDDALSSTDINKSLLSVAASASSAAPDVVSHTVIHLRSTTPYLSRSYSLASAYVGDQVILHASILCCLGCLFFVAHT